MLPDETNTIDNSLQKSFFAFEGQMRRSDLERKFLAGNSSSAIAIPKFNPNPNIKFAASVRRIGGDDVIEETKRVFENYRRQIKPSEVKGAQPLEPGMSPGHAGPKHKVKPEIQADIMNKPDRIFSGINDNGRFVDIYYKNGSAVITEFGNKERVITAYGLIDKGKGNPKLFNIEKVANNARYVEIKLEKLGATNVIYPNKSRFDSKDFPSNPPRPETQPKTNGGTTGGQPSIKPPVTNPIGEKVTLTAQAPPASELPTTNVPLTAPKLPVMGEPPVTPKVLPVEKPPIPKPLNGLTNNLSKGIIILQLIQIGVTAYNASQMEADSKKYGFHVDPFLNQYVITNLEKAAQNLPEGFELEFHFQPTGFSPGPSVTFKVQDGKFVNIDKNFPNYQFIVDAKGVVQVGLLS